MGAPPSPRHWPLMKCKTLTCPYATHVNESFGGFCCLQCQWSHVNKKVRGGAGHGPACCRVWSQDKSMSRGKGGLPRKGAERHSRVLTLSREL